MKIYAKKLSYVPQYAPQKDLDKYIGKDTWVKVLYNDSEIAENGNYWWLLIIDKTPDGFLANGFYDFKINHPTGNSLEETDLDFKAVFKFKKIKVPNPIEAITTDYIYNNYL